MLSALRLLLQGPFVCLYIEISSTDWLKMFTQGRSVLYFSVLQFNTYSNDSNGSDITSFTSQVASQKWMRETGSKYWKDVLGVMELINNMCFFKCILNTMELINVGEGRWWYICHVSYSLRLDHLFIVLMLWRCALLQNKKYRVESIDICVKMYAVKLHLYYNTVTCKYLYFFFFFYLPLSNTQATIRNNILSKSCKYHVIRCVYIYNMTLKASQSRLVDITSLSGHPVYAPAPAVCTVQIRTCDDVSSAMISPLRSFSALSRSQQDIWSASPCWTDPTPTYPAMYHREKRKTLRIT